MDPPCRQVTRVSLTVDLSRFRPCPSALHSLVTLLHGEHVQVFQYANAAAVDAEAAPISGDGMAVGTRKTHWIGSPRFFKKGEPLVLYVGDNDKVLGSLEAVLGHQFAGP
jgi:hypothetical protein